MVAYKVCVLVSILCMCFAIGFGLNDRPCAARKIAGKSVVCVCNATYCDTVTREPLASYAYTAYTSSLSGLRFNKTQAALKRLNHTDIECSATTLVLHPDTMYQTVEGFGGAVTDAAAINWKNLSEPLQKYLIDSYFSDTGLEYNMLRVPIGGADFSTHAYAYNELPADDAQLTNYTLTSEDLNYKIPMIKAGMQASSSPIHVIATTWSPPPWMKSNNAFTGHSQLKPQYYQTYADYHYKFLQKYLENGVSIWGITTTNEPTNGLVGFLNYINDLGWTAESMGNWIVNNLGPTIRNSTFKDVKILTGDDQRLTLPYWINVMITEHPKVLDYIDGIAVHYYTDFLTPAAVLSEITRAYPDKFIIATEACEGTTPFEKHHVDIGSWIRAKKYIIDIIDDVNHNVVGWIDWNLCLNVQGGPNYIKNFADSPIIVFPERNAFIKQPMFYAMGHFSKFVPRGSRRIGVSRKCGWGPSLWSVAFMTPRQNVVVVLYNELIMSSNRSKKMLELVQVRDPSLQPATQDKEHESVPSTEVTMLGDITNKPENQRYSNLQAYFEIPESASASNENNFHDTTVIHDCTDEKCPKSDDTNTDLSDQDPTYEVPTKKPRQIPVYPSRSKSSLSSSSSTSSSSSSSSGSSSDSSDTDSNDEHKSSHDHIVQEAVEIQSEQININEPATTDVTANQENGENTAQQEEKKKGRKRIRNEQNWKQNQIKRLRNAGKPYINKKNKAIKPRSVQPPCGGKCRLKCCDKITGDQRQSIFDVFWSLGKVDLQRSFIYSCMTDITPKYKYSNARNPRNCNKAFHFLVEGQSVRVCKRFFMKTLDISDRFIRTVKSKTSAHGILAQDLRGQHSNHVRVDEQLLKDIKQFIDAIPRIESHYVRQYTTREYIDGGKTIADLFRDFKENQNKNNKEAGRYCTFYKVFTLDYNISFFRPRKDQCDLCLQYKNSTPEQKVLLKESYDAHLEEKTLSRQEKYEDRCKIDDRNKVLVFDLQAVLQSPRGDTSGFYYKSKLNSYNFTTAILNKKVDGQIKDSYDDVHCFFWNETDAKRGANEIGSCLLKVFEKLSAESSNDKGCNLILYSDNCAGQNKNKFIVSLYLYAVTHLNIESITHKFLIKGHTQNEGDNIHSLIEKEITKNLKSGPIYSPHQYISIIKNAKKTGKKFSVHELTFESFLDLKKLQEDWGVNFNQMKGGGTIL